ncbi:GyrI-like domain-containing protein [Brevibacillus humidisoli]|uniref:GyrI-like domain-containing protein n=1 Tax=Brevibacillus humidisoli TaxID=2895522 RepID=UPI001E5FDBEE|nr:effector binding domain-containing protein [Brevibacillus humidisoli]UFJ40314.1 GyrI-like domain-containing protein [Brevibacillus humidisoli]
MEQLTAAAVVTRTGFQAIGLKWEGTFAEAGAGDIRRVHQEMHRRLQEIPHVVQPDKLLGLSYHAHPGAAGFTHYAVVEVGKVEQVPAGMVHLSVPTLTYAKCEHRKGQEIIRSYQNLYTWIEQQGFSPFKGDLTHLEEYPMAQDPHTDDPEFTILIPIEKQ